MHAIVETVFADLVDGPLAHVPSGRFGANSALVLCTATAPNPRAPAAAVTQWRGATLRRHLIDVPARSAGLHANLCSTSPLTSRDKQTGQLSGTTSSTMNRHTLPDPDSRAPTAQEHRGWMS